MSPSQPEAAAAQRSGELLELVRALSVQAPGALDSAAALALRAQAQGQAPRAAAAAGRVILVEHLQAAVYRHAMAMLGVLAAVDPEAPGTSAEGLLAWAGAAIAHNYGAPEWRPAISASRWPVRWVNSASATARRSTAAGSPQQRLRLGGRTSPEPPPDRT